MTLSECTTKGVGNSSRSKVKIISDNNTITKSNMTAEAQNELLRFHTATKTVMQLAAKHIK